MKIRHDSTWFKHLPSSRVHLPPQGLDAKLASLRDCKTLCLPSSRQSTLGRIHVLHSYQWTHKIHPKIRVKIRVKICQKPPFLRGSMTLTHNFDRRNVLCSEPREIAQWGSDPDLKGRSPCWDRIAAQVVSILSFERWQSSWLPRDLLFEDVFMGTIGDLYMTCGDMWGLNLLQFESQITPSIMFEKNLTLAVWYELYLHPIDTNFRLHGPFQKGGSPPSLYPIESEVKFCPNLDWEMGRIESCWKFCLNRSK